MKTKASSLKTITAALASLSGALLLASCSGVAGTANFELSENGTLSKLAVAGEELAFTPGGGFLVRDVAANKTLDFSKGSMSRSGKQFIYKSASEGVALHAAFTPKNGYIQVDGWLENSAGGDRAIMLDYRLCLPGDDLVFSHTLNTPEDVILSRKEGETETNAFPLAALGAPGKTAVSMAIPWNEPRVFGMVGEGSGLSVRFYLGITPLTRAFPDKASFSFIIYPSRPDWGFRGSLERYYSFYPAQYEPRTTDVGLHMSMVKGIVPENIADYYVSMFENHHPDMQKDLDRDDKYNIASCVYTLVGQREIKFLPSIPKDYDAAMEAYTKWTLDDHKGHTITKENYASDGDIWLREEVESSVTKDPDGKHVISLRNTPWGKNSVSFKVNPSPWLFADRPDIKTVGRSSIALIERWIASHPQIDGVFLDSVGANWPAVANYRRDHIEYAQYPVTFDTQGRLFVYNGISHYEWARAMRAKLEPRGRLLIANGLYAYQSSVAEHYRAKDRSQRIKVGRFFLSALLDTAVSEAGSRARVDRCQDTRLMMGRKYYALTSYDWENKEEVENFFNRTLAFAIFASNTKNYFGGGEYKEFIHEGVSYVDNPEGYYRDKALIEWFLPRVRMLFKAGWQPATLARKIAGSDKVCMERFGSGDTVYITAFNESSVETDVAMKLDLSSLGFTPGHVAIAELAHDGKLEMAGSDEVRFKLPPFKTYIVKCQRR